ncbi:TniQ family protein [Kitasatospora sp. NPDC057198]|uniref:TniQ family protein n=1 Tax=Kitasatospora sp. NPDC057198 TaxID=3346046 RepID=UPI00364131A8
MSTRYEEGEGMGAGSLPYLPVRFVADESNCSFLWRVAGIQGVGVDFLLSELGDGAGQGALPPHLAEVFLSASAADRLAAMLSLPARRLRWALPHLREVHLLPGEQARWQWPWRPLDRYLVPACGLCAAARSGGWGEVWQVSRERWRICERHGRFTHIYQRKPGGVDLSRLPESVRAHHVRGRLERRFGPTGVVLSADAFAIVGWWWRSMPGVRQWVGRAELAGLGVQNAETAWLVVYPEAVRVARALLRYERQRAVQADGPWVGAESRLLGDLSEVARSLALPSRVWRVPVAEWLDRHRRCILASGRDGAGRRVSLPVTALVHQGDEEPTSSSTCLPWEWTDLSERV